MLRLLILIIVCALSAPANAETVRSSAVRLAFIKTHPCPATGTTTSPCPGYVIDHVIPLCAGGPDEPGNMMWQEIRASYVKDAWERKICAVMKGCAAP